MPGSTSTLDSPSAVLRSALTCGQCGARRDCTMHALVRYNRRGWPRCCGEVMCLVSDQLPDHSELSDEPLPAVPVPAASGT